MGGSNPHGQDLSSPTNQLTHPALALHALRSPALSSSSSSLHGHNHNSSLESLTNAGQTSPSLGFGANAMAAHFALNVPSRVSQLHSSPSSQLSRSEQSAHKMNSVAKNASVNLTSTPTGNGFTSSPKDDCSTPTPAQGMIHLSIC